MPSPSTVMLFLLAALVMLVIPGPAVLYITTRSIAQGRRAGLASVAGVELAGLTHVVAATLGLSALLMASALAFSAVKYMGAAYLVLLGVRTLLTRGEQDRTLSPAPRRLSQVFAQGYLVNLLNPKTTLFFFAFLPQFTDPTKGAVASQIFFLGAVFVTLASCTDGLYALLAGTLGHWLKRSTHFRQTRRYVTGAVYIGLGMTAALAEAGRK